MKLLRPISALLHYAPSYPVQHSIYLITNLFCTHTCSLKVTSHTVNLSSDVHLYIKKSLIGHASGCTHQAASPTPTLSIILPNNLSISTLSTSNQQDIYLKIDWIGYGVPAYLSNYIYYSLDILQLPNLSLTSIYTNMSMSPG